MKKSTYVFIFIVVVVILGIVYFSSRGTVNQPQPVSVNTTETETGVPTISSLAILNGGTDAASAVLAGAKTIVWKTSNYPAGAGVNVNLVRKVSDSPKKFTLVRAIAVNAPNNGQVVWVPKTGENASNLYVEVTCSNVYKFDTGCTISGDQQVKVN